jgi:hypothetical protein
MTKEKKMRGGEETRQPGDETRKPVNARFIFGAILLLYAWFSFYQINLPGLHYDEAFEAVPALQLLRGWPVTTFRQSGLVINGQTFPLMTQDYIGAINTYAAIPFIALLGPTPAALRAMSILVGAITLGFTFLLARRLGAHNWPGLAAMLLLAVDPTFIFWNRQGVFVTAITATIGVVATWCWLRRFQGGSMGWTAAGAFLFGLGLYAKLLFIWLIVALMGAVILLNLPWLWYRRADRFLKLTRRPVLQSRSQTQFGNEWHKWPVKEILVVLLAFIVGCWPLIAYNLQTGGTWLSIGQNAGVSFYGVNNLAFGPNLAQRLGQFITLTSSDHLWYLGQVINNPLPILALGIILVWVLVLVWQTRQFTLATQTGPFPADMLPWQVAIFPYLVIGLVILASIMTVSALWITHFALLMPWPAIALAVGGWQVDQLESRKVEGLKGWQVAGLEKAFQASRLSPHLSRLILITGFSLLVVANLITVIRYHITLTQSGGLSTHSDAIYDLSDWLAQQANSSVMAMDWGLAAPIIYLTGGQVNPIEVFGYAWESDADLTARLQQAIDQPATLYLWRAPDEIIFDRSSQFKALYRPFNLQENIEAAFYEQSGRPLLGVTRLVKQGTAVNPPK